MNTLQTGVLKDLILCRPFPDAQKGRTPEGEPRVPYFITSSQRSRGSASVNSVLPGVQSSIWVD